MEPPSKNPEPALIVQGYVIDSGLFDSGYAAGNGPHRCRSKCCAGGVFADTRERDAILRHAAMIAASMDGSQDHDPSAWFTDVEREDADYPSGRCVSTREINDKCAFLDGMGRCSIQVACVSHGLHKWALKPLYCALFPVTIDNGVVCFDDLLQDDHPCCTTSREYDVPMFEACREELTHLLGEEGFRSLENHFAERNNLRKPA